MTLKHVYWVEMSPYLHSARKFLPYPMWDVKNTLHADTTSSLCPMELWVRSLDIASELIPDPDLGVCSVWPRGGRLFA